MIVGQGLGEEVSCNKLIVELTRSEPAEHPNPRGNSSLQEANLIPELPHTWIVLRPTLPNVKCVCEVGSWTSAGRHIVISFCSCRCNLAIWLAVMNRPEQNDDGEALI